MYGAHFDCLHPDHRDDAHRSVVTIRQLLHDWAHPSAPFADGSGDPQWLYRRALAQRRYALSSMAVRCPLP